ncbi:MAG: hypothetical protein EXR75_00605 [Myxococcales bacterium]|nr:hypothetical protein [Myxococcales bacterium]
MAESRAAESRGGDSLPGQSRAWSGKDEPKPRVMQEPGDITDVLDAFDSEAGDPFDISLSVGFEYLSKTARILRESAVFEPGLTTGGFTSRTMSVARYAETSSKLTPRIEMGLYKDLAFYSRIPIVLSNERSLADLDGSATKVGVVAAAGPGEAPLFNLPFKAPSRSGIEYVALGIDFSILNQARDFTKPTWVFGAETRISAGTPMHACNANAELSCGHPGDVNRNGQFDSDLTGGKGLELEARGLQNREPGVTRGTVALEGHSMMSKRIKYVEPYGGIAAFFEFPTGDETDYGQSDFEGALVNHPPLVGTVTLGMMVHPWENREKFMRLSFDMRFEGSYNSEGRDYSELYDALGSTGVRSLRDPKWSRYRGCVAADGCAGDTISVVDESSSKTYFTGLTVVEGYGSYRASGSVTWRIAEFVKLHFGVGLDFAQPHGITHDQPCNPDLKDRPLESGPCHFVAAENQVGATGIPNPAYHPVINAIGRRFYVDESLTFDLFARGMVMF